MIQAQPAQRYEELRRFIDVDAVERSEYALRDAASAVNAGLTAASDRRLEAENQLHQAWTAEGKPDSDALTWAKNAASQDAAKLTKDVQSLREAESSLGKAEVALAELEGSADSGCTASYRSKAVEQEVANLPGIDTRQTLSLVGILNHVAQHLEIGTHPDKCPVCQQAIPLKTLKGDIQARLAELKKYDAFRQKREAVNRGVQLSSQNVEAKKISLIAAGRGLLTIAQKAEITAASGTGLPGQDYAELAKQTPANAELATKQAEKLIEVLSPLKQKLSDAQLVAAKRSGATQSNQHSLQTSPGERYQERRAREAPACTQEGV
ncbi:MAG: hypothetical protein M5U08_11795 [Burkholderiales bacterium]|nr:hypothetical protein [Burkholderiales bacterium]